MDKMWNQRDRFMKPSVANMAATSDHFDKITGIFAT